MLGRQFSLAECVAAPWVERMLVMLPYWRSVNLVELCRQQSLTRTASWLQAVASRPSVLSTTAGEAAMAKAATAYYVSFVSPGAPALQATVASEKADEATFALG